LHYAHKTSDNAEQVAETEYYADWLKTFISPDERADEPISELLYPVINRVDKVRVAGAVDYKPENNQIVAILSGNFYWRSLIRNILPGGSNGVRLVFSNPCTNSFTYQINGPNVAYLGVGDHHQAQYTGRAIRRSLGNLKQKGQPGAVYTGAPLDKDYCTMTLHAYPSDEMKASFTTFTPILFSVAVLLIFGFVSLVFLMYDRMVERRQATVMNTAVRSTAIVSSLFPSEVRDRLYPRAK
jgi:hypothetical protein